MNRYLDECLKYQIDKVAAWNKENNNRFLGGVLFTSGGSSEWQDYELGTSEMKTIAQFVRDYSPAIVEPPPVDPPEDDGLPREQYKRTVHVVPQSATLEQWLDICTQAYELKQTVGFSYDDAGIGKLDDKTAVLHGVGS